MVSSSDSGSFSPGPKIFGKKEGRRRPRAKLASVTVRGPPRKNPTDTSISYFFHTDALLCVSLMLYEMEATATQLSHRGKKTMSESSFFFFTQLSAPTEICEASLDKLGQAPVSRGSIHKKGGGRELDMIT